MTPKLGLENMPLLSSRTGVFFGGGKCFWMLMEPFKMWINSWGAFWGDPHSGQPADSDSRPEQNCLQQEDTSKSRPVSWERNTSPGESGELLLSNRFPGIRMIRKPSFT